MEFRLLARKVLSKGTPSRMRPTGKSAFVSFSRTQPRPSSLSCSAIVIFQAPGSLITGNTIIAQTRVLLGGINAVDFEPYGGGFTGTVVEKNTIIADTTMIKIGISLGGMSWGFVLLFLQHSTWR